MSSFQWKKNIGDSIKDDIIIIAITTEICCALKIVDVKPLKASVEVMGIMKSACRICEGVLVKDYTVHKKWINNWKTIQKFLGPWGL